MNTKGRYPGSSNVPDVLFYEREERAAIQQESLALCLAEACAAAREAFQPSRSYYRDREAALAPPTPQKPQENRHENQCRDQQQGTDNGVQARRERPRPRRLADAPEFPARDLRAMPPPNRSPSQFDGRDARSSCQHNPEELAGPKDRRQLELRGITRTPAESLEFSESELSSWAYDLSNPGEAELAEVERRTWGHRRDLARRHDATARTAQQEARALELAIAADESAGRCTEHKRIELDGARNREKWHRDRARGQRDRFENHSKCRVGVGLVKCSSCGDVHPIQAGCGVSRLCIPCRDQRGQYRRAQLWRAREVVIGRCKAQGRLMRRRRGGPWREWHMVLTMPDTRIGAPADRVDRLFEAWSAFSAIWRRYQAGRGVLGAPQLRRRRRSRDDDPTRRTRTARGFSGMGGAQWSRCFEWTPGADGRGHPHLHVWLMAPAVPRELVRQWWACALRSVGVPVNLETDPLVCLKAAVVELVVHEVHKGDQTIKSARIRATDKGGHVLGYMEGWAVSEVDPETGERASPRVQAAVYMALERRRHVQTSAGLMKLGAKAAQCMACGAVGTLAVEIHSWRSPDLLDVAARWNAWPDHKRLPSRGPLRALAKAKRQKAA